MNLLLLMQDEPFYLYDEMHHLINKKNIKIIGVSILPQKLPNDSLFKFLNRYVNVFGFLGLIKLAWKVILQKYIKRKSLINLFRQKNIRIIDGADINHKKFIAQVKLLNPDLIVSIACPQKIRFQLLQLPKYGSINLHGGYLPDFPGVFTPFWNLLSGSGQAGCTVHWVSNEIDAGKIIIRKKFSINKKMSIMEIYSLISKHGISILCKALDKIHSGTGDFILNRQHSEHYNSFPTKADRKLFKKMGFKSI
jgi:methionyl-tRNA formyltransferase